MYTVGDLRPGALRVGRRMKDCRWRPVFALHEHGIVWEGAIDYFHDRQALRAAERAWEVARVWLEG